LGRKVGENSGKLYKAARWPVGDTAIMAAWKQDLSVCTDRVDGARAAFTDAIGLSLPVVELNTANTTTSAREKAAAAVRVHRDVRHWVVWGCNDENTIGVVAALEAAGVAPADIIGVGINADLSCRDWRHGRRTGNKASLLIAGQDIGATASTGWSTRCAWGGSCRRRGSAGRSSSTRRTGAPPAYPAPDAGVRR
ncbi:MAG TPA: hypothetical protein VEZ46_02725, partial [Mycobacteriales bacterium]|nr:hypothetical protein [Mycobacteriales bacterium]